MDPLVFLLLVLTCGIFGGTCAGAAYVEFRRREYWHGLYFSAVAAGYVVFLHYLNYGYYVS